MLRRPIFASLMLGGAIFVGCDKSSDTPKVDSTTQPAATAVDNAKTKMEDAGKSMSNKAGEMKDAVKDATKDSIADVKSGAANLKDKMTPKDGATTATPDAASMDQAKAALGGEDPQTLMEKAMQYIKDNKLDDAQTIVNKLDAAKSKLPADWAAKIDQLKTMLTTAKAGNGALPGGLPSLPSLGK